MEYIFTGNRVPVISDHWRDVDYLKPEPHKRVLFTDGSSIYYGTYYEGRWYDDVSTDKVKGVLGWMPLPEIPERYKEE